MLKTVLAAGICCATASAKPLKVFILAGQSNMEGHAKISTFGYIGDDPATKPMLDEMRSSDGSPRVCDQVWISYLTGNKAGNGEGFGQLTAGYGSRNDPALLGEKIGPEFTFGIYMHKLLGEPILVIKTAWGGKSLFMDFRPPSAGPYQPTEGDIKKQRYETEEQRQELKEKTGRYYRMMVEHARNVLDDISRVCPAYDPAQGYELAGFVWFQGWNDMCNRDVYPYLPKDAEENRYDAYSQWLACLIRDVRKDLDGPEMPFVIGVMGVGGFGNEKQTDFRNAMSAPADDPEFKGNVFAVQTAPFWDESLAAIDEKHGQIRQMGHYLRTKHKNHANKDGKMTQEEQRAYLKNYEAELISPEEAALRVRGASNAGYHYLGCAKTMGQIGKAFAEALAP
jgi:hypothetical protein